MGASILSRALSPAFETVPPSKPDTVGESDNCLFPQTTEIDPAGETRPFFTTSPMTESNTMTQTQPRTGFDQDAMTKSPKASSVFPASLRKQSYASVKEDSDLLQAFRSRRLSCQRASNTSLQRPSLSSVLLEKVDGDAKEDESPFFDEDFSDLVSAISNSSLVHELVLQPTRFEPSTLETMPDEILDRIFSLVTLDHSKDRYVDPRVDLFSCLLVCKSVHAAALRVLYRHVKIPQSKAFFKFSNSLQADPALGELVQCLDFSHYSSIGFGRTRTTNQQTPYLTPTTLAPCLEHTRNLRAFLVHEHVDDELDVTVLSKVLTMPSMLALDLCSCSSKLFTAALTTVCTDLSLSGGLHSIAFLPIERLSLHECTTLKASVFETLIPKLSRLTHLDVAHTMINDKALLSIPQTARITHLNLERCTQLTGSAVVSLLTQHPAVTDTLIYLNLMADASRYRLLCEDNLTELLPALPQTLRSLNIGGARVNSSHVPHLQALATHLEELGLKGANITVDEGLTNILAAVPPDAKVSGQQHSHKTSSLRYLDLTDITWVSIKTWHYMPTSIVGRASMPLEAIELGGPILFDLQKTAKRLKNPEWVVRELGRRGWYVRQKHLLPEGSYTPDSGYRPWKMGARWWGMRKIPVFEQETGGVYGYYMFKRN